MKVYRGITVAVAAAAALTVAGCKTDNASGSSSGSKSTKASSDPFSHPEDVKVTACAADPTTGWADAKVVVTNHSSKSSNYVITIAFESKDGKTQIGTGAVIVQNLLPGQSSSPQDANSLQAAPAGGYVCKISDAQRNAA